MYILQPMTKTLVLYHFPFSRLIHWNAATRLKFYYKIQLILYFFCPKLLQDFLLAKERISTPLITLPELHNLVHIFLLSFPCISSFILILPQSKNILSVLSAPNIFLVYKDPERTMFQSKYLTNFLPQTRYIFTYFFFLKFCC